MNTNLVNQNTLYPVFFRLDKINLLVIGGGMVGTEKLQSLLKSSPNAHITVIAPYISPEILEYQRLGYDIRLIFEPFSEQYLENIDLVFIATADKVLNSSVFSICKKNKILCNVADSPDFCDFYLGSIVTKGDLKIAISTNGKSPTFAKRFREILESILPDSLQSVLDNLTSIREKLKGDFEYKVEKLNEITSVMKQTGQDTDNESM